MFENAQPLKTELLDNFNNITKKKVRKEKGPRMRLGELKLR